MLDESDFFTDNPEEVKSNTIARLNEIREPLSVINSSAFLLKSNFNGKDGKMARHIDGIQSNVNQIVTILDNACGPVFLEGWKL